MDLGPDLLRGPGEHAAAVLARPFFRLIRLGGRLVFQKPMYLGIAAALTATGALLVEIPQLVQHDGKQPAAKRALARIVFQTTHVSGDLAQTRLGEIGRVGILQAAAAGATS